MSPTRSQQIVLASRPEGQARLENFRLEEVDLPEMPPGGMILRTLYLSLDPYMRGRMEARKSYAPPVEVGGVMEGECVAEVTRSDHLDYRVGDLVLARIGWRSRAVLTGAAYFDAFLGELAPEVLDGRILYREDIVDGLEHAPVASSG